MCSASFRVLGDDLLAVAGEAAEGLEVVYPFDPTRDDPAWLDFNRRFEKRFGRRPETFASLGFDTMNILLNAICRAGLNRGKIRDALTGLEHYKGVTGEMTFDPNCKNVVPMYLAAIRGGKAEFRRYPMEAPYARVGEDGVFFNGPAITNAPTGRLAIGLFGPDVGQIGASLDDNRFVVRPVSSNVPWGKASTELVNLIYDKHVLAIIADGRNPSHLAEQLAVRCFVPVIAISDDRALTAVNIPWLFRMPAGSSVEDALQVIGDAAARSGPNRERLREMLASGVVLAHERKFDTRGELQP